MAMNKNQPLLDNKEITKYVTHVVVPDGSPFYKEEESRKLEEWGIKIITAPATKPKLDTAFYDDAALAKLLDQI
jgi:hypothetical protein